MLSNRAENYIVINKLITEGKLKEALAETERILYTTSNLLLADDIKLNLFKSKIYVGLNRYEESLKLSDHVLNNSQMLDNSLDLLDAIFTKAKALARLGKYGKSLTFIKMGEKVIAKFQNEKINEVYFRKASLLFEKGYIFEHEEDLKNALDNYLQSLSLRREINDQPGLAESNNQIATVYFKMGDVVRSLLIFQQSLTMYKEIDDEIGIAATLNNIGNIYLWKGEYGPALENCLQSLAFSEEIDDKRSIVIALTTISQIYIHLGEFDRTLQYLNRSLSINEDLNNLLGSAATYHLLSRVLLIKGQLNQASDYLTQASEIYQQLENESGLCSIYETQGLILYQRGDYKKATEFLTKSIEHCKNKRNKKELVNIYFWLIVLTVESNLLEEAQKYLKKMQKALEKQSNQISNMEFKMASAFILKKSTNQDILSKAKIIFKDIINNETIDVNLTSLALYNISELILKEVQISRNLEDLKQIDPYIEKHLELAKQLGSHLMIADNFWLKANIALLQTDVSKAVILLEQAEQITDEKALRRLGIKIARGLDILKDHKEETKSLTSTQGTAVSSEIAKVNSEVVRMIDRKIVDIPKLQDEEPVLLIIVFEGGITVFSKKFSQKEMIDEMFVGGFLTAIDAFMHQTFATGGSIERIQHQEYTLLLKVENPLLFCYVFKGQSFTAIQKLDNIVQELKKSSTIWHALSNNLGEQLNDTEKALIGELADQVFLADQ